MSRGTRRTGAADELRLAQQVDVTTLVTAASRSEREATARAIHRGSGRRRRAFVTVSAKSLDVGPSAQAAAAIDTDFPPQIAAARGGTLYVDDIVGLSAWGQARLLALLDEPRFRIIAGASRHLDRERSSGAFAETLFYRLNIVHVDLTRRRANTIAVAAARQGVHRQQ